MILQVQCRGFTSNPAMDFLEYCLLVRKKGVPLRDLFHYSNSKMVEIQRGGKSEKFSVFQSEAI